ncbi:hypothetical protein DIURU_000641 [Diutina rugosa]|uniref:Uncharacterized protein n=1 Tax=Diutina rugosa TaxID=5481 RepID=A0A642V437_DIURU|nr:uncharacterized protein DIURU_000641 [Diutina rugosa]KAA8907321.1 hypothetical protein DIURU_000641 [Diutina rugosa]
MVVIQKTTTDTPNSPVPSEVLDSEDYDVSVAKSDFEYQDEDDEEEEAKVVEVTHPLVKEAEIDSEDDKGNAEKSSKPCSRRPIRNSEGVAIKHSLFTTEFNVQEYNGGNRKKSKKESTTEPGTLSDFTEQPRMSQTEVTESNIVDVYLETTVDLVGDDKTYESEYEQSSEQLIGETSKEESSAELPKKLLANVDKPIILTKLSDDTDNSDTDYDTCSSADVSHMIIVPIDTEEEVQVVELPQADVRGVKRRCQFM